MPQTHYPISAGWVATQGKGAKPGTDHERRVRRAVRWHHTMDVRRDDRLGFHNGFAFREPEVLEVAARLDDWQCSQLLRSGRVVTPFVRRRPRKSGFGFGFGSCLVFYLSSGSRARLVGTVTRASASISFQAVRILVREVEREREPRRVGGLSHVKLRMVSVDVCCFVSFVNRPTHQNALVFYRRASNRSRLVRE